MFVISAMAAFQSPLYSYRFQTISMPCSLTGPSQANPRSRETCKHVFAEIGVAEHGRQWETQQRRNFLEVGGRISLTSMNESVDKHTQGHVWRFPEHTVPATPTRGARGSPEYFPNRLTCLWSNLGKYNNITQMRKHKKINKDYFGLWITQSYFSEIQE